MLRLAILSIAILALFPFTSWANTQVQTPSLEFGSVGALAGTTLLTVVGPSYGGFLTLEGETTTGIKLRFGGAMLVESGDFRFSGIRSGAVRETLDVETKGVYVLGIGGLDKFPVSGILGVKVGWVDVVRVESCMVFCNSDRQTASGMLWRPVFGAIGVIPIWNDFNLVSALWILGENDINYHRGKSALQEFGNSFRLILGVALEL